jgi:2-octaprenyl-6-methoxyphenol hydroxylase
MASPDKTHFDIVIVGAGMVGASMACALLPMIKRHQLKVALVEAFPLPDKDAVLNFHPGYDDRSTALSYGSRCIYEQFGIWSELTKHATPIKQIHVSDRGHFGSARLNTSEHGIEALGYVIENAWLGRILLHYLFEQDVVHYICPATVEQLTPSDNHVELKLAFKDPGKNQPSAEGKAISADLVIIADGGRSDLNKQLHIDTEQHDYQQAAIIANVSSEMAHNNVAYERFTPDGPVALLPLKDPSSPIQNRSSLVFTVANDQLDAILSMQDEEFIQLLQARFGFRLGVFIKVGKRNHFPLMLRWAKEQVLPGVVVIGNSAHTLHPVAGQGFNLALRGVYELAGCLSEAVTNKQSPGGFAVLDKYLQQRDQDQSRTIGFTDQAVRLFSNNDLLLGKIREAGLIALDLFPLAKRLFGRQAMGLGDRLPPAH